MIKELPVQYILMIEQSAAIFMSSFSVNSRKHARITKSWRLCGHSGSLPIFPIKQSDRLNVHISTEARDMKTNSVGLNLTMYPFENKSF